MGQDHTVYICEHLKQCGIRWSMTTICLSRHKEIRNHSFNFFPIHIKNDIPFVFWPLTHYQTHLQLFKHTTTNTFTQTLYVAQHMASYLYIIDERKLGYYVMQDNLRYKVQDYSGKVSDEASIK